MNPKFLESTLQIERQDPKQGKCKETAEDGVGQNVCRGRDGLFGQLDGRCEAQNAHDKIKQKAIAILQL
jgi:hypothetical protein